MEAFLQDYGILAALVGGTFQGEIVYLTAMLTVSMGYLDPYSTAVAFFIGSTARDWGTFYFARKKGEAWVNRKPKLQSRAAKISERLDRSPLLILLTYRFIYGLKMVILLVAGISKISWTKFAVLSAISNLLWILVFGALGFFCAQEVIEKFSMLGEYTWEIIGGILLAVVLYWAFFRWRRFKRECAEVGIDV